MKHPFGDDDLSIEGRVEQSQVHLQISGLQRLHPTRDRCEVRK